MYAKRIYLKRFSKFMGGKRNFCFWNSSYIFGNNSFFRVVKDEKKEKKMQIDGIDKKW